MQSVARPFFTSRRRISCGSVVGTRAPDAPTGCPSPIAPPFALTVSVSQPRSSFTAHACALNASFAITRSRPAAGPARFLERTAAGRHRAAPHDRRVDAPVAQETMRVSGSMSRFSAFVRVISTQPQRRR